MLASPVIALSDAEDGQRTRRLQPGVMLLNSYAVESEWLLVHDTVILTDGLTKFYKKQRGIVDLSLTVSRGEVFGFLGPNGAGKTTTIRLLLDFLRPTRGRAALFGITATRQDAAIRRRIGYLPGELSLYENLTGIELLRYFKALRGVVRRGFVEELAERLECHLLQPIRSLSRGNKQKIGLIQALMHEPELLILDEPTSGLDPLMQREFYRLISEARTSGRTVFLSSHNLPEVERVCDRAGIIRDGRLVAIEKISDLKKRALRKLEIHFEKPVPPNIFQNVSGVLDVQIEGRVLHCAVRGSMDALVKAAAQFDIHNIISHEPGLEEIFLAYYSSGGDRDPA